MDTTSATNTTNATRGGNGPLMQDHSYDGIQEYDNPTPGWWWMIFAVTIVFSMGYFLIYHADPYAPTVLTALEDDRNAINKKLFAREGDLQPDQATLLKYMYDPSKRDFLAVGASIFRANCIACHGAMGEGAIGPNMTDDYYKNIKELTDVCKVISGGAAAGAMPAWSGRLSQNEVVLVGAYVASLRGKNLPGRVQEGEKIPAFPEYKADGAAKADAGVKK